jgi:hypothetical protein
MSPQTAAALTGFVGVCLLAGWLAGFRNRAYVAWLGLAFVALGGFLLALAKQKEAQEMGAADPRLALVMKVLLFVWLAAFVISLIVALRETSRRLRELRESHEAAAAGLLEVLRASREADEQSESAGAEGEGEGPSGEDET